jgi:hypothetical protein
MSAVLPYSRRAVPPSVNRACDHCGASNRKLYSYSATEEELYCNFRCRDEHRSTAECDRLRAVNAELLAALREAAEWAESMDLDPQDGGSVVSGWRSAIARAEGRS